MFRKLFVRTFVCTAVFAAAGCASIEPMPEETTVYRSVAEKTYVTGAIADAFVGNDIIRVRHFVLAQVDSNQVEAISDFVVEGPVWSHRFHKGDVFPLAGTVEYDGARYTVAKVDAEFGVLLDAGGHIHHKIVCNLGEHSAGRPGFNVFSYDAQPPGSVLLRKKNSMIVDKAEYENYRLVFSGTTSDAIRLTYLEYPDAESREAPASQDLIYPIGSRTIRFRTFVVNVVEVTPEHLRYRIAED